MKNIAFSATRVGWGNLLTGHALYPEPYYGPVFTEYLSLIPELVENITTWMTLHTEYRLISVLTIIVPLQTHNTISEFFCKHL